MPMMYWNAFHSKFIQRLRLLSIPLATDLCDDHDDKVFRFRR